MVRVGQRHAHVEQVGAAALVERLRHVGADLLAEQAAQLDLGDQRAGEACVASAAASPTWSSWPWVTRTASTRSGSSSEAGQRGVAVEPGIDVDAVARRRVETEGGVAEPGECGHARSLDDRGRG